MVDELDKFSQSKGEKYQEPTNKGMSFSESGHSNHRHILTHACTHLHTHTHTHNFFNQRWTKIELNQEP